MNNLPRYQIGDWVRFYSNSLRGPGATTHIGKICGIATNPDGIQVAYDLKNAAERMGICAGYVIEKIEVDEQTRKITRDVDLNSTGTTNG